MSTKRMTLALATAAAGVMALTGGVARADIDMYSHDFTDDVGDWVDAIAHNPADGTATATGYTYSYFGSVAERALWPAHGYVTELDVYLDPAALDVGEGFDLTVASSRKDETHLRDFIFHVGVDASGDLLINGSNNTDFVVNDYKLHNDGDGTPALVTEAGWYTFQHTFRDAGDGSLAVDLTVLDSDDATIFTTTRNNPADTIADVVGGVRYQWFTFVTGAFEIDNQLLSFVVPEPASKDDCKKDGFVAFGFENQGQCVASVQANDHAGK